MYVCVRACARVALMMSGKQRLREVVWLHTVASASTACSHLSLSLCTVLLGSKQLGHTRLDCKHMVRTILGYKQLGPTKPGYKQLGHMLLGCNQLRHTQIGYKQLGQTSLDLTAGTYNK